MERSVFLRVIASAITLSLAVLVAPASSADPGSTTGKPSGSNDKAKVAKIVTHRGNFAWCHEDNETLPNGLCYIDGRANKESASSSERRTLVIFLHGMIAKDVDWQWLQARALTRQAKQSRFEAVFARAPLTAGGYVWPGTIAAQEGSEQEIIDGWEAARSFLEKRNGKPYDEVFLMGFSSGAYFVSALALRGRVKFDGYATFAGGAGGLAAQGDVPTKAPVFVGVCAEDSQTAAHSRAFGGALAAKGWPHRVDEQKVGHMFADVHVAHAVTYLRSQMKKNGQ